MSYITKTVVHSFSAFIVWPLVVDIHSDLTTLIIMPSRAHILTVSITADDFRLQSSREISGPEVGVLKTVVTTNPLCLRKLWVISSVLVIGSKCRHVALHFLMKIRCHLHRSTSVYWRYVSRWVEFLSPTQKSGRQCNKRESNRIKTIRTLRI